MIRLVTVMVLASLMLGCGTFGLNRTIVEPAKTAAGEVTENEGEKKDEGESVTYEWNEVEDRKPFTITVFGRSYEVPVLVKTMKVELKKRITEASQNRWVEASATGLGISTTSSELVGTMEFTPPTATTNGAHSDAGGMTFDIQKMSSGGSMYILFGLGGLCVIGGLVILVLVKQIKLGLVVSAGGFALIFAGKLLETYPWAVLVAFGVILVIGGLFVYNALVGKKKDIALNAVVRAVEKSPDSGKTVKEKVGQEAGKNKELVKDVITKVKREEGLAT